MEDSTEASTPLKGNEYLNQIECQLLTYIEELMAANDSEERKVRTLVFMPAGVPGMGKTTIGRFLESAAKSLTLMIKGQPARMIFKRISYDVVFSGLQSVYRKEHPEVSFLQAFEVIRPHADKQFLDMIHEACKFTQKNLDDDIIIDIVYIDKNNTPD